MPADLEDRLREALTALRDEPPETVGRRLAERAVPHLGGRRWRRRLRRAAGPALATAAVAAVGVVLLILLTVSPDPMAEPARPDPRGTGIELVLQVTPRDGSPAAEVADRLARTMQHRAVEQRVEDTRVAASGDRVTVFVPRTHDSYFARSLFVELDLSVYDVGHPVLSTTTGDEMIDELERRPVDGAREFYLAAGPSLTGPFGTSAAALRSAPTIGPAAGSRARAVAVPAGLRVVYRFGTSGRPRLVAVQDRIVASGDVQEVRADGNGLEIVLRPDARERVRAALTRRLNRPGTQIRLLAGIAAQGGNVSYSAPSATLRFAMPAANAAQLAGRLPFGGIEADVAIVARTEIGPPEPRRGDRVSPLPPALESVVSGRGGFPPGLQPARDSIRRVVRVTWQGEEWTLWSMRSLDGSDLLSTVPPRPGPGAGTGTGGCPIVPVTSIFVCGSAGAPGAQTIQGRVGPTVARIEAVYADGSRVRAGVSHGFFMIFLPTAKGDARRLAVIDGAGREIDSRPARFP